MLLSSYRPVYSQLVDLLAIGILDGTWAIAAPLPAIDALAQQTGLNPRAVAKAYAELEGLGALELGAGEVRTVATAARRILQRHLRERFLAEELPQLARRLRLMGIDPAGLDWPAPAGEVASGGEGDDAS